MKHYILSFFALLFTVAISSQDSVIQTKIDFFNSKIQQTQKAERLQWMDSLTSTVWEKTEFKYDAIARQTIDFAIQLDSLTYASNRLSDLIYYHVYIINKPKEAISLFHKYSLPLEQLKDDHAWGKLYLYTADGYAYSNDLDKAIAFYKKSIAYGVTSKKTRLVALAKLYLGFVQSDKGLLAEASLSFKDASQIFTQQKDTINVLSAKNGLSILYSKNAFYKEARKERDEAITLAKQTNSFDNLVSLYYNAAEDDKRAGNRVEQIAYLKASLAITENSARFSYFKPNGLAALTNAYAETDSLALAELNFKKLEAIYEKDNTVENRLQYVDAKRTLSFAKGEYSDALKYGREFLESQKERRKYENIMMAEKFLAKVYRAMDDNINSNARLVNYYAIKDSISSVQNVKSLVYYQTLYETEKRDLEIKNQKTSIGLLNLTNKNKTQLLWFGSIGLLMAFGSILFYRSFVNTKKRAIAQQEFSQQLITAQEQERNRVSKDLHDSVGQQLTFIKKKAQNLEQQELSDLANVALEEVRSISRDLYPATLKQLGLTASIEQLLFDLDGESELFFSVELEDINTNFNETETLNLYRFIQESVTNVLKHADAKTLIVNIFKRKNIVEVLIKDNGCGFQTNKGILQNSLGLKTMAERIRILKGKLSIQSTRELGTTILVKIPV
ncbi:MAG: signal transduction histidine kinase [Patiriisocius sp.]|jgi:signal transduction histidine kinase